MKRGGRVAEVGRDHEVQLSLCSLIAPLRIERGRKCSGQFVRLYIVICADHVPQEKLGSLG